MQRMLVVLVVFLTAAVGVLGMTVLNLSSEVETLRDRKVDVAARRSVPEAAADEARIRMLEERTSKLLREVDQLRKRPARQVVRRVGVPAGGDPGTARPGDGVDQLTASKRERDADGGFILTAEDEELFLALQKRAERRRRIESTTKNVMRRLERMAQRGEIGTLDEVEKAKLEDLLTKYVEAGDDVISRYLRQPAADIKDLGLQEKRELLGRERDQLVQDATAEMLPLLGDQDALKVAEAALQSPWGRRRERGGRNRGMRRN